VARGIFEGAVVALTSHELLAGLESAGLRCGAIYPGSAYGSHDASLFAARALIQDGFPIIDVESLSSFPPHLERFGAIGRETAEEAAAGGYPADLIWQHLARTVPPKALNAIGGMLEILTGAPPSYDPERPFRVAAVIHVSDVEGLSDLLERLAVVPGTVTAVVTSLDGLTAARLQPVLDSWTARTGHDSELRVTPASPGRDMSDLFVACRDVLLSDDFDLVLKVHSRRKSRKTVNVRRYFRRYQWENLLEDEPYVRNLLALFQSEPRLGIVFPPMMHIGYATMGNGWAGLRGSAQELCRMLGISVPLDVGSPLAPYGGMFVARPAALRLLAAHPWSYGDYNSGSSRRFGRLAHVQERVLVAAAGQLGYHARTVLSAEHAAISHTALEYKTDEMSSTTRGWPVEQIRLLHRAGSTGYGGPVALARMYLRLNHPRVVGRLRPLYRVAFRSYAIASAGRRMIGRLTGGRKGSRP
jgi:lipopolysaccharide biosynthesis protein